MKITTIDNFKAVEFMRTVRKKMTEQYHKNKEKYFADLKAIADEFKRSRKQPAHNKI